MDLVFSLPKVALEIYHGDATQKEELRDCSFSKFSLSKTDFKYKMQTDSTMQAELSIQDLIINDTRRNVKTKFREIIPANLHDSPQISLSLSTFDDKSMLVLFNLDSPKIIFHLEYVFALQNYFTSVLTPGTATEPPKSDRRPSTSNQVSNRTNSSRNTVTSPKAIEPAKPAEQGPPLHYRVSVNSPEIILLANAASSSTDAIILSAHQVVLSQQETMTLIVDRVGMFLCKMDKREDTCLRFIDNFDIALSMGTRSPTPGHQLTNITLDVRPLVLRLSYRDAMLVMDIVNKATELQSKAQPAVEEPKPVKQIQGAGPTPRAIAEADRRAVVTSATSITPKPSAKRIVEEASFVSTRETVRPQHTDIRSCAVFIFIPSLTRLLRAKNHEISSRELSRVSSLFSLTTCTVCRCWI
jgi:vacuolar protein sorting-associated protein 13A/C